MQSNNQSREKQILRQALATRLWDLRPNVTKQDEEKNNANTFVEAAADSAIWGLHNSGRNSHPLAPQEKLTDTYTTLQKSSGSPQKCTTTLSAGVVQEAFFPPLRCCVCNVDWRYRGTCAEAQSNPSSDVATTIYHGNKTSPIEEFGACSLVSPMGRNSNGTPSSRAAILPHTNA